LSSTCSDSKQRRASASRRRLTNAWFFQLTVVVELPTDSPMAQEEVFAPALPIWRIKDSDDAIERANNSPFGLGSV
jgi:acyl-CoA reductase-like NAD-dependent aldehyde dehydrogenase